jgi:hypothetical protein
MTGILVHLHPVPPRIAEASQLQSRLSGPDGQPDESSQLFQVPCSEGANCPWGDCPEARFAVAIAGKDGQCVLDDRGVGPVPLLGARDCGTGPQLGTWPSSTGACGRPYSGAGLRGRILQMGGDCLHRRCDRKQSDQAAVHAAAQPGASRDCAAILMVRLSQTKAIARTAAAACDGRKGPRKCRSCG